MSMTVKVSIEKMTDTETVKRMLQRRLDGFSGTGSWMHGSLSMSYGARMIKWSVNYDVEHNSFSFDGDLRERVENRLNELYQVEKAIETAESLGMPYEETMDAATGEITLTVDDTMGSFDQLIGEVS